MSDLVWSPEMSVQVDALDDDHRRLFAIAQRLSRPEVRSDKVAAVDILGELIDYARDHFTREEAYMERIGFPGLADHRQGHEAMLLDIVDVSLDQSTGIDGNLGNALHTYLQRWLVDHIMGKDRQYARFAATRTAPGQT